MYSLLRPRQWDELFQGSPRLRATGMGLLGGAGAPGWREEAGCADRQTHRHGLSTGVRASGAAGSREKGVPGKKTLGG